jgi:hypothetical protein
MSPAGSTTVVCPEIAQLLGSGLIMYLGTRGADLAPEMVVAPGARVEEGGGEITVFVPRIFEAATLENLRDNGQAALTIVRVTDNRSIQIKGTFVSDRVADEGDRRFLESLLARRANELALVGLPRSVSARLVTWPAAAIRIRVRELFVQTPGPGAGRPLDPRRDLA